MTLFYIITFKQHKPASLNNKILNKNHNELLLFWFNSIIAITFMNENNFLKTMNKKIIIIRKEKEYEMKKPQHLFE
jgi:hypothetical protein